MDYNLISSVTETEYEYDSLPTEFDAIKICFLDLAENTTDAPVPPNNTLTTIAEDKQYKNNIDYYYEVEIDDYIGTNMKYELEFYLSDDHQIIDVSVDKEPPN